jgi:hypothetical protein
MKTFISIAISCCLAFAASATAANAQPEKPAPRGSFSFVMSADGGTIWRMNNATGEVSYCVTAIGQRPSACGPWMK